MPACMPASGLLQRSGLGAASQDALLPGAERQRQRAGSQLRPVDARDGCLCVSTVNPMHPWLAWLPLAGPPCREDPNFAGHAEARVVQGEGLMHGCGVQDLQGAHAAAGHLQRGAAAQPALLCLPLHLLWDDGQPGPRYRPPQVRPRCMPPVDEMSMIIPAWLCEGYRLSWDTAQGPQC